jgi:drug/metabolite transporter (DMT)-like permease
MPQSTRTARGFIIALIATVIWSTTAIFISYLNTAYQLPALVLAFWRDLFVSLGMLVGLLIFSRRLLHLDRTHWNFMIIYGLVVALFNSMWTLSVQYNGAAVATVMAFSSPAMTALLSRIVHKETFSGIKVISILLSIAGIIFVSGAYDIATWNLNPLGIIFGLLTGLMFAIYNLQGKAAADRQINSWTALLHSFAWATVFLFFFNIGNDLFISGKTPLADMLWLGDSISGWGILFFLGVVPTLGGFGLYTLSLRYLSPTTANLIATLEPAFTAVWAYLFLSEILTSAQLIGSVLVLISVMLLRFSD